MLYFEVLGARATRKQRAEVDKRGQYGPSTFTAARGPHRSGRVEETLKAEPEAIDRVRLEHNVVDAKHAAGTAACSAHAAFSRRTATAAGVLAKVDVQPGIARTTFGLFRSIAR